MPNTKNENDRGISILSLVEGFRRRKAHILIPAFFVTLGAAALAFYLPLVYRSETTVVAEPMLGRDYLQAESTLMAVETQLQTIRENLFRRSLLEQVIDEFELYKNVTTAQDAAAAKPEEILKDMESRIEVRVEGEETFTISFESESPKQAAEVANRLAELFIQRQAATRERRLSTAVGFVSQQVESVRQQLTENQRRIQQYKESTVRDLPDYLSTNLGQVETLLTRLQQKNDAISTEEARRVAAMTEMEEIEKQFARRPQPQPPKSETVVRLEELRGAFVDLRSRYTNFHPDVVRLRSEIERLERIAAGETPPQATTNRNEPTDLEMRYVELKADLEGIQRRLDSHYRDREELAVQLDDSRERIQTMPQREQTLNSLMREYEITRTEYESLLDKLHDTRLAEQLEQINKEVVFRIAEPARVPTGHHSPRRYRIILLGLLAGLGFGVLLAFVAQETDTTFNTVEEFQAFTNLPVLAVIPSLNSLRKSKRSNGRKLKLVRSRVKPMKQIVTLTAPLSLPAEQYRILAARIRKQFEGKSSPVIVVTSPAGAEGKTTTAINLSVALSEAISGPILLADVDLRRPKIHEYLGIKTPKGFRELLSRPDDDLDQYVECIDNLHVMANDSRISEPAEVLSIPTAPTVLSRLRRSFQYIVLDAPPILPMVDSYIVSNLADGIVLLVRARYTRRELLRRAVEAFESPHVLGAVLNDVNVKHTRYAYAYRYYEDHYQQLKAEGKR